MDLNEQLLLRELPRRDEQPELLSTFQLRAPSPTHPNVQIGGYLRRDLILTDDHSHEVEDIAVCQELPDEKIGLGDDDVDAGEGAIEDKPHSQRRRRDLGEPSKVSSFGCAATRLPLLIPVFGLPLSGRLLPGSRREGYKDLPGEPSCTFWSCRIHLDAEEGNRSACPIPRRTRSQCRRPVVQQIQDFPLYKASARQLLQEQRAGKVSSTEGENGTASIS